MNDLYTGQRRKALKDDVVQVTRAMDTLDSLKILISMFNATDKSPVTETLHTLAAMLANTTADWDLRPALGVVLAAGGYPNSYSKGDTITGLTADAASPDVKIFQAGTAKDNDDIVTNGGRVLCCVALGDSVADAQCKAYSLVDQVCWDNVYCRRDIGYRAVARENKT